MFKKGQYLRHVNPEAYKKFGLGIVIEDQYDTRVQAFFENLMRTAEIRLELVEMKLVENPGEAEAFLKSGMYRDDTDRIPFPDVLDHFLEDFEGGLSGEMYIKFERSDKDEMHRYASEHLSLETFKSAMESGEYSKLAESIQKSYSHKGFSLLARFEMVKLHAAFSEQANHADLVAIYNDLIHGGEVVGARLESARKRLEKYEMDKWPIITFPLFVMYPDKYIFVKPEMTKTAAENRGFNIAYSSQVNSGTYQHILDFASDLWGRLSRDSRKGLHPKDMIDIQGFMWCTFAKGWTREGILEAKEQIAKGAL